MPIYFNARFHPETYLCVFPLWNLLPFIICQTTNIVCSVSNMYFFSLPAYLYAKHALVYICCLHSVYRMKNQICTTCCGGNKFAIVQI